MAEDKFPERFYRHGFSRHEGDEKNFTTDCERCDFYRYVTIGTERRLARRFNTPNGWHEHRCYWGIAIKVLEEPKGERRKCGLDFEKSPREIVFDEYEKWERKWRTKES